MDSIDNILSILLLIFIIFVILYLIYKNNFFCKKIEFYSNKDCKNCKSCKIIEKQKKLCGKNWMYDETNPKMVKASKIANCYDWKCYENCYNSKCS